MIKTPAYLSGFSSRKDKSASIRFTSQELTADELGELQDNLGNFGWLIFAPEDAQNVSVPKEAPTDNSKTPSQRLRAVIYVLWEQNGSTGSFESYYAQVMEKLIDKVKAKLDD